MVPRPGVSTLSRAFTNTRRSPPAVAGTTTLPSGCPTPAPSKSPFLKYPGTARYAALRASSAVYPYGVRSTPGNASE